MGKILAIDYGKKRIGLAETDELQIIASGLSTESPQTIWSFLATYIPKNNVEELVVGDPKNLDGSSTDATQLVEEFLKKFQGKYPQVKVHQVNEIFTSKMAKQTMLSGGLKKKARQNKALVDQISATIILQDFLSQRSNGFL